MIRDAWTAEIQAGLPIPESLYCSPLRRALETHDIIFGSLVPPDQRTTLIDVCRRSTGSSSIESKHLPLALPQTLRGTHLRSSALSHGNTLRVPFVRRGG